MRKLPVYFLIDVSESMVGEPIAEVEKGVHQMIRELRKNPYALETVYIGVIVFAGKARTLVPLSELTQFNLPDLFIGSGTNLGAGLDLLMDDIDREVSRSTMQKKGDWKPIVFLFTDGRPTSDPASAVARWESGYKSHCNLVSVIFGDHADVGLLRRLGEQVFMLKELTPETFSEFFKWVSASIEVSSQAVAERGEDGTRLAESCINLEKAAPEKMTDNDFVILTLRCPANKKIYLAKYGSGADLYNYIGAYQVEEGEYKNLSATNGANAFVDVARLDDLPVCPHCGRKDGFIQCNKCNQLFCSTNSDKITCPWCGNTGKVRYMDHFDVGRNLG